MKPIQKWFSETSQEMSFDVGKMLAGGSLGTINSRKKTMQKSTSNGSSIKSTASIDITGNSVLVQGSDISGDESVSLTAKKERCKFLMG